MSDFIPFATAPAAGEFSGSAPKGEFVPLECLPQETPQQSSEDAAPDWDALCDTARREGWEAGFLAAQHLQDGENASRNRLAESLGNLELQDTEQLRAALGSLLIRQLELCLGTLSCDAEVLQQRCDTVFAFLEERQQGVRLEIAATDAGLTAGLRSPFPIVFADDLKAGSVRLVTDKGAVEHGSCVQIAAFAAAITGEGGNAAHG